MDVEEVTERLAKEKADYESKGITTKNVLIPESAPEEETPNEE